MFKHSVYFLLIFITMPFFLLFFQIVSCCVMKKKTLCLKGKHDQPASWFETIKSVMLLPQVAFHTRN
jgi:hypothetical protein